MDDNYLQGVRERIAKGEARPSDWKYSSEAFDRLKNPTETRIEEVFDPLDNTITFTQGKGDKAKKVTTLIPEGYELTKFNIKKQKVFTDRESFISPDVDGHNGGVWKKASSFKKLEMEHMTKT